MNSCPPYQLTPERESAPKPPDILRGVLLKLTVIIPAVAVLIVMLFMTMGHVRLSEAGRRLIGSLIYSFFIGLPSAIVLTWTSFRWTERLGRFLWVIQTLELAL